MAFHSVLQADEIESVVRKYSHMLFKICLVMLCNEFDAEDAVQETFYKYISKTHKFGSEEHEKAWLITVATNTCRNMRRYKVMHNHVNIDDMSDYFITEEDGEMLEALMALPDKFKEVLLLYYVEEYHVKDIAKMIGRTPSAVKMRLQKGRALLKQSYTKGV